MCFKAMRIWFRCDTNSSSWGEHNGLPVSTFTVSGFREPFSACSFPGSLCLRALFLSTDVAQLLTAHQKSFGWQASGHVFHSYLCGQWRVFVKSFDFAFFHQNPKLHRWFVLFQWLPLHSFMVNDKLCSLYTHWGDICVPFIGLDQGSPTQCPQRPPHSPPPQTPLPKDNLSRPQARLKNSTILWAKPAIEFYSVVFPLSPHLHL